MIKEEYTERSKEAYQRLIPLGQPTNSLGVASDLSNGVTTRGSNMGIIRREKSENYSVIYNECFQDDKLSARAKGIFAYLMTLPDDWKIYKKELQKHFKEGRDALNKAFDELETAGYISKVPERGKRGRLDGWDYTVYESTELLKTRNTDNPCDGEPAPTKYLSSQNTKETNPVISESKQKKPCAVKQGTPELSAVLAYACEYATKNGLDRTKCEARAREGFAFYEKNMRTLGAKTWKDSRGDTVKSWKLKIANVWFKEIEKPQPRDISNTPKVRGL